MDKVIEAAGKSALTTPSVEYLSVKKKSTSQVHSIFPAHTQSNLTACIETYHKV